jgi:hypothetical protein
MRTDFNPELDGVEDFYDARLVGDVGPLGFRRTAELRKLRRCLPELIEEGILRPGRSSFLDLGCGDGRVNVWMSYLARVSIGVELDEWTLEEHAELRRELEERLQQRGLRPPAGDVHLFHGDATDPGIHALIQRAAGVALDEIDIFYTFSPAHAEFASLVATHGRSGCAFLVYAVNQIFPDYDGLERFDALCPLGDVLAVYRKRQL